MRAWSIRAWTMKARSMRAWSMRFEDMRSSNMKNRSSRRTVEVAFNSCVTCSWWLCPAEQLPPCRVHKHTAEPAVKWWHTFGKRVGTFKDKQNENRDESYTFRFKSNKPDIKEIACLKKLTKTINRSEIVKNKDTVQYCTLHPMASMLDLVCVLAWGSVLDQHSWFTSSMLLRTQIEDYNAVMMRKKKKM